MKLKTPQEDVDVIVKLTKEGKSSRKILPHLKSTKSKSTVNNIIALWKAGEVFASWEQQGCEDEKEPTTTKEVEEAAMLETLCEHPDWNVANLAKRLRTAQRTNNQLRKVHREVFDGTDGMSVKQVVETSVAGINTRPRVKVERTKGTKLLTAEVLLSDIQYGKLMDGYNTDIAVQRVAYYCEEIIKRIKQHQQQGYEFEEIVVAIIGDVIESDKKHSNSGRACDSGTAEQLKVATENLFVDFLEPLAELGIPMNVVCVTGNHDHDDHGLNMFKPGQQHLSWPLFHSLRMITEARGYTHVTFDIPEGCFSHREIYGFGVIYEHGVGVSVSDTSLTKRLHQRSDQLRKHLTYFRMGDKHSVHRFNEDTKVVNGALFGGDDTGSEYSSISGYCSDPAQITLFHTPREDKRLSVCDSLVVQLKHIK